MTAALVAGLLSQNPIAQAGRDASGPVDFARDLEPLFKEQCVVCHNAILAQGGLRLDSRVMALRGGLSGPALVPGRGQSSLLVKRLLGTDSGLRMPQNMEPWSAERIGLVQRWIDEGALWPTAETVATPSAASQPTAVTPPAAVAQPSPDIPPATSRGRHAPPTTDATSPPSSRSTASPATGPRNSRTSSASTRAPWP